MKQSKISVALVLILSGCIVCSKAIDAPTAALPSGPLVALQMPEFSQWTVDITYSDRPKPGEASSVMAAYQKAAQSDPVLAKEMSNPQFALALQNSRPVHILVTKTGKVRHEERELEGGTKGELWKVGDDVVEQLTGASQLSARNVAGLAAEDFPEFAWIAKDNFVGVQTNQNHKCLEFKKDYYSVDDHSLQGTKVAYIDYGTRYPVSYQFQAESRIYTIMAPPTISLTVPAEVSAAAGALEAGLQREMPHFAKP